MRALFAQHREIRQCRFNVEFVACHVLTEHAAEISRPISQIGIYPSHFPKGSDYIRTVCSNTSVNLSLRAKFQGQHSHLVCRRCVRDALAYWQSGRIVLSNNLGVDDSRHAMNLTANHLIKPGSTSMTSHYPLGPWQSRGLQYYRGFSL